jgi:hypothetical protein
LYKKLFLSHLTLKFKIIFLLVDYEKERGVGSETREPQTMNYEKEGGVSSEIR